ncbi:hypothetical protein FC093_09435 [Ilyomonas limi]|uniref:Uncharacterized protein n=1 Tax=Ilyomonas limi TaxID=2575867 RepID=A0A4U3L5L0_9BACT|nr:hypothetical protein FC093_09435 [Ilyomonas limi]
MSGLKKYLYVLGPLLACVWIMRTNTMAPTELDIILEGEVKGTIRELLHKRKTVMSLIRHKNYNH